MKTTAATAAAAAVPPSPDETTPIATLVPVLAILDSFNHRNKNQHRVARWWSAFDLLRRAIRRLHDALEAQACHRRALSFKSSSSSSSLKKNSSSSSSSGSGKPIVGSAERRQNALDEDVAVRVRMLLDSTIPSSFSAFTQLAADNQHAALGLVLLGLLARINSVVTLLAPAPAPAFRSEKTTPAGEVTTTSSLSTGKSDAAVAVADERRQQQSDSKGLGVAISRDQLKLAAKPSDHHHSSSSRNVDELPAAIPPKKRRLTAGPPLQTKASKPAKEEKPVKKKKKSKKTDDFGDLFSSLM
ncbi:hypothetical protein CSAL01_03603 [Colletotrichum salicis]|uniref:RNase MRP protein 1 RNA binding domain-containing protein n=1 Tax=Colletotrichum salicis TaxID=1209931 RepID=A0A135UP89_9PEZI|nr:hypothetical protein CSAL01_03603 [Colletotrichum salicis]